MKTGKKICAKPWRRVAALVQMFLVVGGALLGWLAFVDELGGVSLGRWSAIFNYVANISFVIAIIIAFLLHRGFRAAIVDGDRMRTWQQSAARYSRLMALGCLTAGVVGLLITSRLKDRAGMQGSLVVIVAGGLIFGAISLLCTYAVGDVPAQPPGAKTPGQPSGGQDGTGEGGK